MLIKLDKLDASKTSERLAEIMCYQIMPITLLEVGRICTEDPSLFVPRLLT